MYKAAKTIFMLALCGALFLALRGRLQQVFWRLYAQYFPCTRPITYRVASFDARFGISKKDFVGAIRQAEQIWEKPLSKDLFAPRPEGELNISLVYDARQEATEKLEKLGLALHDDQASYDALKVKYDALHAQYDQMKLALASRLEAFQARKNAYDEEIARWNRKGGAPKDEYERLQEERTWLEEEARQIHIQQDVINAKVEDINALVVVLKRIASSLNLSASQFNEVGRERGQEFEEGLYTEGPEGRAITIYQFDDMQKLVRVLAHELGHALGLEHLENPKAIMYRLNQGENEKLTSDDIAALKKLCGVK